jgi:hypothetical protein
MLLPAHGTRLLCLFLTASISFILYSKLLSKMFHSFLYLHVLQKNWYSKQSPGKTPGLCDDEQADWMDYPPGAFDFVVGCTGANAARRDNNNYGRSGTFGKPVERLKPIR